jgi:hypothetical protein
MGQSEMQSTFSHLQGEISGLPDDVPTGELRDLYEVLRAINVRATHLMKQIEESDFHLD